jgi:hypothetical protein
MTLAVIVALGSVLAARTTARNGSILTGSTSTRVVVVGP